MFLKENVDYQRKFSLSDFEDVGSFLNESYKIYLTESDERKNVFARVFDGIIKFVKRIIEVIKDGVIRIFDHILKLFNLKKEKVEKKSDEAKSKDTKEKPSPKPQDVNKKFNTMTIRYNKEFNKASHEAYSKLREIARTLPLIKNDLAIYDSVQLSRVENPKEYLQGLYDKNATIQAFKTKVEPTLEELDELVAKCEKEFEKGKNSSVELDVKDLHDVHKYEPVEPADVSAIRSEFVLLQTSLNELIRKLEKPVAHEDKLANEFKVKALQYTLSLVSKSTSHSSKLASLTIKMFGNQIEF